MRLLQSFKNSLNVSIETQSLSLNPKDAQPNFHDGWGLPSKTPAWYPQKESTSAMLCLLETLRVFSMSIPTHSDFCRSLTSGLFQITVWPQEVYFLGFQVSYSLLTGPSCYIHGIPWYDFCQIKSIMLIHWFVHHKLNTIGLKLWAPPWGKSSQFPKRDPSLTQSHNHGRARTHIYSNRCIINIDKEA